MQSSGGHIQETLPQGCDVPSLPAPSCLLARLQPEQAEPEQTRGFFPLNHPVLVLRVRDGRRRPKSESEKLKPCDVWIRAQFKTS